QAHVLERVAADTSVAQADRQHAGHAARRRALHLYRRLGLLRPQRSRGRSRGCRAAGQGDGIRGARPMDAAGRARLGSEGPADALAAAVGLDPLDFRLRNLNAPRGVELLQRLAKLANWPSRTGRVQAGDVVKGRGVSYVNYELVRTYVGVVADVEVDKKTGKV